MVKLHSENSKNKRARKKSGWRTMSQSEWTNQLRNVHCVPLFYIKFNFSEEIVCTSWIASIENAERCANDIIDRKRVLQWRSVIGSSLRTGSGQNLWKTKRKYAKEMQLRNFNRISRTSPVAALSLSHPRLHSHKQKKVHKQKWINISLISCYFKILTLNQFGGCCRVLFKLLFGSWLW